MRHLCLPLTALAWQGAPFRVLAPFWACFQCVLAHRPLDSVEAADQTLFKDIVPNPAGAIGLVAGLETRVDGRDELRIKDRSVAERAVQPFMEARA